MPYCSVCIYKIFDRKEAFKMKKSNFLHAKSKTRIACRNGRTLGTHRYKSAYQLAAIKTMKEKNIELWLFLNPIGHGVTIPGFILPPSSILDLTLQPCLWHCHSTESTCLLLLGAAGSAFYPISECIILIHLNTHRSNASVIAIYAPTNPVSTNAEASVLFDHFYDLLQDTLSSVSPRDMVIILGDFNASFGSDFMSHSSVVSFHGLDECNENGMRFLNFCVSNQLPITSTWFQHKPLHQVTWYCNGDCSRPGHMMDFVLVNSWFCSSVIHTRVFCFTYNAFDHKMVVFTMTFKITAKRHQNRVPLRQTMDFPPNSQILFRSNLVEGFSELSEEQKEDWVTDELLNLSKKKKDAWLLL